MHTTQVQFGNITEKITFYIGQNAQDNVEVIILGESNDMWFHAKYDSSCHVVASVPKSLSKKQKHTIIKHGASLCKRYTKKLTFLNNVEFVYTPVQYVDIDDVNIGQVTIVKDCKTIMI